MSSVGHLRRVVGKRDSCGQTVEVVPPVCLSGPEPYTVHCQAHRRVPGSLGPAVWKSMGGPAVEARITSTYVKYPELNQPISI